MYSVSCTVLFDHNLDRLNGYSFGVKEKLGEGHCFGRCRLMYNTKFEDNGRSLLKEKNRF